MSRFIALIGLTALSSLGCGEPVDGRPALCKRYASAVVHCAAEVDDDDDDDVWAEARGRVARDRRASHLYAGCLSRLSRVDALDRMLSCAAGDEPPSCADFEECRKRVADRVDAATLQQLTEAGDVQSIVVLCESHKTMPGCADAKTQLMNDTVERALPAVRDGTSDAPPSSLCFEARALARSIDPLPPGTMATIQRACAEASAGLHVRKALEQVSRFRKTAADTMPYRCKTVIAELGRIKDSPWARDAKRMLVGTCYLDLGTSVLEKRLAKVTTCDAVVRGLIGAIRTHKLKSDALTPLYHSALKLCPLSPVRPSAGGAAARPESGSRAPTRRGPAASRRR